MPLAASFMQIVIQVRAGRHEAVDVPVGDEMRDDQPQAAGAERPGHAEENRDVVFEHLLPDTMRRGEIAPLERDPLHAEQDLISAEPALDGERLDRRLEEAGFLLHSRTLYVYGDGSRLQYLRVRRADSGNGVNTTSVLSRTRDRCARTWSHRRTRCGCRRDPMRYRSSPSTAASRRRPDRTTTRHRRPNFRSCVANVRVHAWPASANTAAWTECTNRGQVPTPR